MQQSKLIEILRTFQTKELTRFKEYVHSPFFNKHKVLIELCDYILEFAPKFNSEKLEKKAIFKHLFPKKKYNETNIYTHTSNLLQLLTNYLAHLAFEEKELQVKLYTLQELRLRNLEKQFNSTIKQVEILLEKATKDREFHFYTAKLYDEIDRFNPVRSQDQNIQVIDRELEIVFLIDKMQLACDMINRNSIIGSSYAASGIDLVLKWIESNKDYYIGFPEVRINYTIYKLIKTEEKEYYDDLKHFLSDKTALYPKSKTKLIYDYLINYCIKKLNAGDSLYHREFFELHRFLLSEGILLLEDDSLSEWDYKNMVTVGARLGEFDWVKSFIFEYKDSVRASSRENVFTYNLAYYYFSIKDYNKALELLHQVEFTDASYYIGAKIIQLKSYYALNEIELVLSLIATFNSFIKRSNVLSDFKKGMNQNMLKLTKKIIALETNKVLLSKKKFEEEKTSLKILVETTNPIANADWLLEILKEI